MLALNSRVNALCPFSKNFLPPEYWTDGYNVVRKYRWLWHGNNVFSWCLVCNGYNRNKLGRQCDTFSISWLKKHALELFDIERFSKMACMYFFSKVLICSGWFNRPNLASFAAHFPISTNYMYMYSVSSSQLPSPFSRLSPLNTLLSSPYFVSLRLRPSFILLVLRQLVLAGDGGLIPCCDRLLSLKQIVRAPLPNARYKVPRILPYKRISLATKGVTR